MIHLLFDDPETGVKHLLYCHSNSESKFLFSAHNYLFLIFYDRGRGRFYDRGRDRGTGRGRARGRGSHLF